MKRACSNNATSAWTPIVIMLATTGLCLMGCDEDAAVGAGGAGGAGAGSGSGAGGVGGSGATTAGGNSGQGGQGGSGGALPTGVPMFVAQGHMARTTISCDGGNTWLANQSQDDATVCWEAPSNTPDCDHNAWAGRGIAYGDGWFVATFGWGMPGGLRRSNDGLQWEETLSGTTFSGVAYGNGVFMAGDSTPRRSVDHGATWEQLDYIDFQVNTRRTAFANVDGGRFLIVGDAGRIAVSANHGDTWGFATASPECGDGATGIASNSQTIVINSHSGTACVSQDGGATFSTFPVSSNPAESLESGPVWTGSKFMAWSNGQAHSSSDGETWTSEPTNVPVGPVAVSATGELAAIRGGWQVWYDEQQFYRSTDGVQWDLLGATSFVGSHPMTHMVFGYAELASGCGD